MTRKQVDCLIVRLHELAALVDCIFIPDETKIAQLLDEHKDVEQK